MFNFKFVRKNNLRVTRKRVDPAVAQVRKIMQDVDQKLIVMARG